MFGRVIVKCFQEYCSVVRAVMIVAVSLEKL